MSTGEFIDTLFLSHSLLCGETVNCCQHVEDLKAIGNSRYHNNGNMLTLIMSCVTIVLLPCFRGIDTLFSFS